MKVKNVKIFAITLTLLVLSWLVVIAEAGGGITVKIFNRSNNVLYEDCYSKDDNLGLHELQPGEFHAFSFNPNIWGTTKFWCALSFGDSSLQKHIMAYKYRRDSSVCGVECEWYLSEANACHWNPIKNREDCSNYW
uniref:S-protein homolog n=1 Tax=Kalanchoe fedtschenkoi TaxID=63787 RepID=A0A7N0TAE6_KALFE